MYFSDSQEFVRPAQVRPVLIVIANLFAHEALQIAFVEHDYMIEQVVAPESRGSRSRLVPLAGSMLPQWTDPTK